MPFQYFQLYPLFVFKVQGDLLSGGEVSVDQKQIKTAKRKLDVSDSLANHEKKAQKEKEHIFGTVAFTDADIPDTEEIIMKIVKMMRMSWRFVRR